MFLRQLDLGNNIRELHEVVHNDEGLGEVARWLLRAARKSPGLFNFASVSLKSNS